MGRSPILHDRDAALRAGVREFWHRGYHATSMKDLERATGMHPGSVYAAFGSKLGFFTAALDRYSDDAVHEISSGINAGETPLRGLAAYVRGFADGIDVPSQACMLVKTLLEASERDHPLRDGAERGLAAIEHAIREALGAAKAANLLRDGIAIDATAQRIQLNLIGLRSFACRPGDGARARAMAETIANEIIELERANLSAESLNGKSQS
ncbi:MAG: TetR/AcrR family transcriptional regulator [Sphingomicrobium sp.]